jgi:segregation and condensation protein B
MSLSLKQKIEAVLFLENRGPVELGTLVRKLGAENDEILKAIQEKNDDYQKEESVFCILQLENAFKLSLRADLSDPVLDDYREGGKKRISKGVLETLVIVAYKQPVTKAEVEAVRGVNSAPYLKLLLDDDLVKVAGRKNAPGRPVLYKTTAKFLLHFGLKSLSDLPTPQEVRTYDFLEERQNVLIKKENEAEVFEETPIENN